MLDIDIDARSFAIYARPKTSAVSLKNSIYWRLEPDYTQQGKGDKTFFVVVMTKAEFEKWTDGKTR
jgi:hypothetical protein